MTRVSAFSAALTFVVASVAMIGIAQAAPPVTDNGYSAANAQPATNVAEHVIIRTPTGQTGPNGQPLYVSQRKPQKIWISMGFGF